jgi:hypothetical protein
MPHKLHHCGVIDGYDEESSRALKLREKRTSTASLFAKAPVKFTSEPETEGSRLHGARR